MTKRSTARLAAGCLVALLLSSLAACSAADPDQSPSQSSSESSSSISTGGSIVDSNSAIATAKALLLKVNLSLPAAADGVTVDQSPLPPFVDPALISFSLPVPQVLEMCRKAGAAIYPSASLGPQDQKVLRGLEPADGSTLCSIDTQDGQGPAARIVVPPASGGQTTIAVYQLPSR